ncbi:transglutaminase family protein [Prosthecomicrobium hirschii]|uniref:Transglutaminase-like domain-containing protein n=1 Tax=Prosthecodimorpha hirschii TaxID=665126 RepID=A0A0P6VMP5_9HYPH|nr:transglutaminase family protein [Prosthecomicrobium hirschii]KPL52591.1 hypothetical protein ABB55_10435 [Prosthecomicrobium hirschii]MCW1841453.1 transglutaminase family protein [Prosthecomicrobium hirschii]TPQ52500.1 transglutaminase family protein [Prosthecomicrobium hirschii]
MIFTIRHRTTYRYSTSVLLGPHRLMTRPRGSFDMRLIKAELATTPPATLRWHHDPLGNAIAIADFHGETDILDIVSTLVVERFESTVPFFTHPAATAFPIAYQGDDLAVLEAFMTPLTPDADGVVDGFMQDILDAAGTQGLAFLDGLNQRIHERVAYSFRWEEGTQDPVDTIRWQSGSCRDMAWLFVECARRAGFAARFVTGYLYDQATDLGAGGLTGGGATHAWAEVFIPETGWVEYDPTNRLVAGEALLRVAVARSPGQASPISGSYTGPTGAAHPVEVEVSVTSGTDMQTETDPVPVDLPSAA